MKFLLVALIAVTLSVVVGKSDKEWEEFKKKHGKRYTHPQREAARRTIWEKNREKIEKHNKKAAKGEVSYFIALNQFSDMSDIEKATVKGLVANGTRNNASSEELSKAAVRALPARLDLRTSSCMTPIRDQGECGSCWAFSATALVDYYNCKKKGSLTKYSEQQLVDCDTLDQRCNGGFYTNAWKWLQATGGQCLLNAYNYTSGTTLIAGTCKNCTRSGTVAGFKWVYPSVTSIKSALATVGPVSAAMCTDDNFVQYASGMYDDKSCTGAVDHAVVIIGYDTWTDGSFYWIVRNSWGISWGTNGYIFVKAGIGGIESLAALPVV